MCMCDNCDVSVMQDNNIYLTEHSSVVGRVPDSSPTGCDTGARIYENVLPFLMLRGFLFNSIQEFRENYSQ